MKNSAAPEVCSLRRCAALSLHQIIAIQRLQSKTSVDSQMLDSLKDQAAISLCLRFLTLTAVFGSHSSFTVSSGSLLCDIKKS